MSSWRGGKGSSEVHWLERKFQHYNRVRESHLEMERREEPKRKMEEEGDKERGREIEPFELTEQSASSVSEKIHAYLKVCL